MRIYQNIDGGDIDIVSDGYKMVEINEIEKGGKQYNFKGLVTQIQSRMVAKEGEGAVDIGCGNAFGGKNEEEEEGGAAPVIEVEKVNDLIEAFQYQEANMAKAEVGAWLKGYGKLVLDKIPEVKHANFKAGFKDFAQYLLGNLADFTIYTPSDWNQEGTLIFSFWQNEEDAAPIFWYLLDGLKMFKV